MRRTEASIQAEIVKRLNALPECLVWKNHGSQYSAAGVPDITGVLRGRMVAFEVKRPGQEPTPLQSRTLERLEQAGALVGVVTSWQDVESLLVQAG